MKLNATPQQRQQPQQQKQQQQQQHTKQPLEMPTAKCANNNNNNKSNNNACNAKTQKALKNMQTSRKLAKRQSYTTLICQLTRLKMQQKYLECTQHKLNPAHFTGNPTATNASNNNTHTAAANDDNSATTATDTAAITALINEIEQLKLQHDAELSAYRADAHRMVHDMWVFINAIKDDVGQPHRLRQFSMDALRERIITINTQLERLKAQNLQEHEQLQRQFAQLESETKVVFK